MGLDATVSYPQIDLVVENPFDFPILVEARAANGEMYVELVGQARPREVSIERRIVARRGYRQQELPDASLAAGARVVEQRGIRGARVQVTRTIIEDGETRVVRGYVRYPSTDEIVRVGTGPSASFASASGSVGPLALR
jgi:vancomycin resistance protein YoaR